MATVTPTPTRIREGESMLYAWVLTQADTEGASIDAHEYGDRTVQISGTFDGATVVLQGSNDGTNWFSLTDPQGNAISKTTAAMETVMEVPLYTRCTSSGGGTGDRYANGTGLQLFVAADTALGANAPTCIINYLDTGGGAGATTTFTSTASLGVGQLLNSGTAANKYNPFLPLAAGDTGVSDIVSVVWSGTAHASGTVVVCLAKPLWTIPVPATGLYTKVDFLNAFPSLPRIRDGANIQFLLFQTGATTSGGTIMVDFDWAYGG